jgi:hypothetical protein
MIKNINLMESYTTYVNKGSIRVETDIFPEFVGKTNSEISELINNGKYYVDEDSKQLLPIPLTKDNLETLGYLDEDGESAYDGGDLIYLWEYHGYCGAKFDKIKENKIYVTVTD